jgi:predicted amidohydrolase
MRAGVVQFRPEFGDPGRNVERMLDVLSGEEADLFVFPELALSGYIFESRAEATSLAQSADGEEFDDMSALASDKGATIIVGFAERDRGKLYNASLLIAPDGTRAVYRKIQLFSDEKRIFDPGDRPPQIVEVSGVRLGMMVCFDWIFPEVARTLGLAGADILCHCANLVLPYCQDAMITRCIENRVYALTANRIGTEKRAGQELTFTGRSQAVSPRGDVLVRAGIDAEELLFAEIDPELARVKNITEQNNLISDRRPDMYRLG